MQARTGSWSTQLVGRRRGAFPACGVVASCESMTTSAAAGREPRARDIRRRSVAPPPPSGGRAYVDASPSAHQSRVGRQRTGGKRRVHRGPAGSHPGPGPVRDPTFLRSAPAHLVKQARVCHVDCRRSTSYKLCKSENASSFPSTSRAESARPRRKSLGTWPTPPPLPPQKTAPTRRPIRASATSASSQWLRDNGQHWGGARWRRRSGPCQRGNGAEEAPWPPGHLGSLAAPRRVRFVQG